MSAENVVVAEHFTRAEERTLPVVAQADPMAMVANAVQQGMSPETIRALLDLRDRMEANEARKAFVVALNAFKANAPKIIKTKEVSFGAGKTAYKHALAGAASEQIGQALAVHGISHRWNTEQKEGGIVIVSCILTHSLGHSETVTLQASPDTSGSKNSIQAIGSTVSYLQRYTLFAATGLVPQDADDDGRAGKGNAMPEKALADWLTAIEMADTIDQADAVWKQVLEASTAAGDIAAHEQLRGAMLAKRKAIRANEAENARPEPKPEPEAPAEITVIDAIAMLPSFNTLDAMSVWADSTLSNEIKIDPRFTKAFRARLDAIKAGGKK